MKNLQEKKLHGRPDFPFAVYPGRLPEFGREYPLHWHEELELICIHSGIGVVTVQARQFVVREGDLILVPPQQVHSIRQHREEEMHYHTVLFRLSLLEQSPRVANYTAVLLDKTKTHPVFLQKGSELNSLLRPSVGQLLEYREKRDTAFDLLVYAQMYTSLYHIVRHCGEEAAEQVRKSANYEKLRELLTWLKVQYPNAITVSQAAARCGFSESHFMRLFRELTGTSFAQYVKQLRLTAAADLLRTTGDRVGEIAESTGFHNLSYFTRAFSEKYHMSPGDYRKQWEAGQFRE